VGGVEADPAVSGPRVLADHPGAPADLHEVVTRPGDHADLGADVAGLDRVAGAVQAHQAVAVDLARHDQLKPIGRPTHRQQMGPLGGQRLGRRGGTSAEVRVLATSSSQRRRTRFSSARVAASAVAKNQVAT
jgi:hypothetical protein